MNIQGYLEEVRGLARSGQATEHSYRPALEGLFKSIDDNLTVINEPKRLADVGAIDFVFNDQNGVGIGWCEAKDLFKDITKFKAGDYSREQKERYKKGFSNLIYTNGTDFEFIREGAVTHFISIADLVPGLPARPEDFPRLEMMLKDFSAQTPISIKSAKQLAKIMAGKAAIIKDMMGNALVADKESGVETELTGQYEGFKRSLIRDITIADFADVYAETIAYGLFAARLHDPSLGTFSRAEALELLPKSNPFLRNLFFYIASNSLDERLRRIIDDLCDIFRACDVGALMQDFGKWTARNDPFLHFYESFLAEYNPAKRKARGVWYTPEPVVNFIVRAVDDVLKTEFNLPRGIADTSKIQIDWDTGQNDPKTGKPLTIKKDVHRVQILDPATGTGTFLAEAIKQIAAQVKDIAPGMWSGYVEENLIPRLHGFELLMASYAMCHMKLDMMLTDMGYKPSSNPPRLGVYLTNSLEEGERVEQTLPFARWLSEEAKGANTIKRDTPIMCVIGNPPYSVSSSNRSPFIESLIVDYKRDLNERNMQPLSDDYIKFIRYAQHLIEKNGEGVLGFITNNSYLDGVLHRQMRRSLLNTFDKIFIVDLHGSTKKLEKSPDGSIDANVFDIMQGVAIIVAIKTKNSEAQILGSVCHIDMWGSRKSKYENLYERRIVGASFNQLRPESPSYYFAPKNFEFEQQYFLGAKITDLFSQNLSGIKTGDDKRHIAFEQPMFEERESAPESSLWVDFDYRPFDRRKINYDVKQLQRARYTLARHIKEHANISLNTVRQLSINNFSHVTCSTIMTDLNSVSVNSKEQTYFFPLYLYPEEGTLETERRVNFDPKIYADIRERAGLSGVDGDELKVFDYIYGVLHSPDYRATYAQFLKIDFPRIPFPASPEVFAHIADKGGQLRRLHLMEDAAIGVTPYPFSGDGENVVAKPAYGPLPLAGGELGRVHINPDQYFDNVPHSAWEFHIGGYQPAQKWLKDRKGRALSFDDVLHYQKIIKILTETDRIMREIELPL